jgi:hypothetical protein
MPGARKEDQDKADDLQTMLEVNHVFFNGTSADDKLFIGPHFRLNISGTNYTRGFETDYNRTSTGIVHRRRLCERGEYIAPTNYCEECPSYQFSTVEAPNGSAGHEERNCTPANDAAHAPGGAVLVPISGGNAGTWVTWGLLALRAVVNSWLYMVTASSILASVQGLFLSLFNMTHMPAGVLCCTMLAAWHGVNKSLKNCTDCPRLYATFGDIRK